MGLMRFYGQGVDRDTKEAVSYFRQAANKGHIDAQSTLGMLLSDGSQVSKDDTAAAAWFMSAAKRGHTDSQVYTCAIVW